MDNPKLQKARAETLEKINGDIHFYSIGGSYCYGTQHADSDVDVRGFYVLPSDDLAGILGYQENRSFTSDLTDAMFHEVGKFVTLALKANPNVLEPLFYDIPIVHEAALPIYENRDLLLSRKIRDTSVGYARSQWGKLMGFKDKERFPKYIFHVFRLLYQAKDLLETGRFSPIVSDERKSKMLALPNESLSTIYVRLEKLLNEVDGAYDDSPLPENPDWNAVNDLILECRSHV